MSEKLVRDRIPDIMARKGIAAKFRRAAPEEFYALLCAKLIEEAKELQFATTTTQRFEELGDVLEVIDALIKTPEFAEIRRFELEGIRESKTLTTGGFSEGWVLISDTAGSNPSESSPASATSPSDA